MHYRKAAASLAATGLMLMVGPRAEAATTVIAIDPSSTSVPARGGYVTFGLSYDGPLTTVTFYNGDGGSINDGRQATWSVGRTEHYDAACTSRVMRPKLSAVGEATAYSRVSQAGSGLC